MKKSFLIFCFFLSVFTSLNAQQNSTLEIKNTAPKSIYTFKNTTVFYDFETVNKNLNLSSLSFVFVNPKDIDNGQFSIPFKNIGKKPSSLIYDDYNDYQHKNLLKGFLRKNDPTYWNPRELQLQ